MSGVDGGANNGGGVNAESGESGGGGDSNIVWFLYAGQPNSEIPRDITHLRIDPSVKRIAERAFQGCEQLVEVELCEGLEYIGRWALSSCKSLKRINKFPSTVIKIANRAFQNCEQLVEVELCEGLEEVGEWAFFDCKSLKHSKVPSTVKWIGKGAFADCKQLVDVELSEGLERIDEYAFMNCKSLERMNVPSTVKKIGRSAFENCERLVEVELREGLEAIGGHAFHGCKSLERMKIPSTAKFIRALAFVGCDQLVEVELREGLERIDPGAFKGCKALKRMKIPSTVTSIAIRALCRCQQLIGVELCNGVEKIDELLFESCSSLRNVAVPSEAQALDCFQSGCHDLLKVFGSHQLIGDALKSRFGGLPIHKLCYYQSYQPTKVAIDQLKNIISEQNDEASSLAADSGTLERSGERRKRAANWIGGGSNTRARRSEDVSNAADSRSVAAIDSSSSPTDTSNSIDDNNAQDCLGMTPLHILACSTKQDLELYQFIVASQPKSLITEDKWGCLPIFYAIWGGTSYDIMLFLIKSQKAAFPNYVLDWDHMIETLCRAGASLNIVNRLLDTQEALYSDRMVNWQKAAREMTIRCLVRIEFSEGGDDEEDWRDTFFEDWEAMMDSLRASPAYRELVQSLLELQQRFFSNQNDADLQLACEELVKPLTGWWRSDEDDNCYSLKLFRFLVKCNVAERLNAIGVRKWRMVIGRLMERTLSANLDVLENLIDDIHSKLVTYERDYHQLKDVAFSLELILWKSKVDELEVGTADLRRQCRINCGADIIIPNVLPYLIADEVKGKEEDNGGDEDNSMDDSEEGSDDDDIL